MILTSIWLGLTGVWKTDHWRLYDINMCDWLRTPHLRQLLVQDVHRGAAFLAELDSQTGEETLKQPETKQF